MIFFIFCDVFKMVLRKQTAEKYSFKKDNCWNEGTKNDKERCKQKNLNIEIRIILSSFCILGPTKLKSVSRA